MRKFKLLSILLTVVLLSSLLCASSFAVEKSPSFWKDATLEQCQAQIDKVLAGDSINWLDVQRAIFRLADVADDNAITSMGMILDLTKEPTLEPDAPLPSVMSPLNMLKAAVIDTLAKMGIPDFNDKIKEIALHSDSDVLKGMAKDALKTFELAIE